MNNKIIISLKKKIRKLSLFTGLSILHWKFVAVVIIILVDRIFTMNWTLGD